MDELHQYLQLLDDRERDMSEEERNKLDNDILQNPQILSFYLQLVDITEPNYAKYRAFMPTVINLSRKLNFQQFFENGLPYFGQIIQYIIDGKDLHNMTKIYTFFLCKTSNFESIIPIYEKLKELTHSIRNQAATVEDISHAVWIYRLIAKNLIINVQFRETVPLFQFTLENFDLFFNMDFLLNNNTRRLMKIFLKMAILVILNSFDECMRIDDSNSILQKLFQFIPMLTEFSQIKLFKSDQATETLIQIVVLIRNLISKASIYIYRFPDECKCFIAKYHQPLLENCIETINQIRDSFPNDLYRMINYNLLCIINQIVSTEQSQALYENYGGVLFELSYNFSSLPAQYQQLLEEDPSSYYWNAYCIQPFVVPEEPRSFSLDIIKQLFRFSPTDTLNYILQLPDTPELMPIFGFICELLYHNRKQFKVLIQNYVEQLAQKAQQIIVASTLNEDTFYFMTQIIFLLPLEQLDQLTILSKQFLTEFGQAGEDENITPRHQFLFTLACRAIRLLLSIQYTNQNIEQQIIFIIQHCEYCFTADGINILYGYCKLSDENFKTFGKELVEKAIFLYAQVTQNFTADNLDKIDERNVHQFRAIINECMKQHCEILPLDLLKKYVDGLLQQETNDIENPITEFITIAAGSNYPDLPGLLEIYFEQYHGESKINNTDQFLMPFLIFIENRTQDFLNWGGCRVFVEFIFNSFSELFSNIKVGDVENTYYFSNALCMLILIPGLLSDQNLQSIIGLVVPHLAENQDLITFYIIFDIVTSIIYRFKADVIPDIIPKFVEFISSGCVVRTSEKIRYSKALNIVLTQTTDEEMKQYILNCLELLSKDDEESPLQEEDIDWFFEQENIGLNAIPIPFGFQE